MTSFVFIIWMHSFLNAHGYRLQYNVGARGTNQEWQIFKRE